MRAVLVLVLVAGCRQHAEATRDELPPVPMPAAKPMGSDAPSFARLKTPDGEVDSTPAQTLATLRANCDRATRDNNFAVACFSLGQLYDTGTFVARDPALAIALHGKSCELGEMKACAELGAFYDEGTAVPRDPERAKAYSRRACDGGNGRGCNNLVFLHPGTASKQDLAYVLGRYQAICDTGGDPEACATLGDIYRIGEYLPVDARRAAALYGKACDAGHPMGCNNLGALRAMGVGGPKDAAQAAELYARACSLGSREGCLNAGIDPATAPIQIKR
jgi:TPR repeat protein